MVTRRGEHLGAPPWVRLPGTHADHTTKEKRDARGNVGPPRRSTRWPRTRPTTRRLGRPTARLHARRSRGVRGPVPRWAGGGGALGGPGGGGPRPAPASPAGGRPRGGPVPAG